MNMDQHHSLMRKHGKMDPLKAVRLRRQFEKADDLFTTCRQCGKVRTGTMEQLKEDCGCVKTGN